jgi:fumarate reductase iron-sulfur subunit
MKREKLINVQVSRYDPDVDESSYFKNYKVPFEEKISVMNVLEYIYENLDHSLAFFVSCKRGNCGRCVVSVNGKNCMACTTEIKGDFRVGPAKGKKVVRDLRVDGI